MSNAAGAPAVAKLSPEKPESTPDVAAGAMNAA